MVRGGKVGEGLIGFVKRQINKSGFYRVFFFWDFHLCGRIIIIIIFGLVWRGGAIKKQVFGEGGMKSRVDTYVLRISFSLSLSLSPCLSFFLSCVVGPKK